MGREEENGGDLDECGKGTGKGKGEVGRGSWKGKWEGVRGTMDMGKGLRGRGEGKTGSEGRSGIRKEKAKEGTWKGKWDGATFPKEASPHKTFFGESVRSPLGIIHQLFIA